MTVGAPRTRDDGAPSRGRRILIVAGPNGAGKTTFARQFLPHEASCPHFVNADLIAAGLAPFAAESAAIRAGRVMLAEIRGHVARGENFAFETTLAGRRYARLIPEWQRRGYSVHIDFLALPDADLAVARVAVRVRQGGHDVPEAAIRRRFTTGRANFESVYRAVVDSWAMYDASGPQPVLVAKGGRP
jgi:predicted ABC-type ATPase